MSAHQPWMGPQTSIEEASRSREARRRRDLELAAWCGLSPGETEAFVERVELFDRRTRAHELMAIEHEIAGAEDSRTGLIARVNDVIADLVDQLSAGVTQ